MCTLPTSLCHHLPKKTKNNLLTVGGLGVLPMSLIPFPQPQDEGSTYLAGLWKLEILYKVPSTGPRDTVITITILSLMQKNT